MTTLSDMIKVFSSRKDGRELIIFISRFLPSNHSMKREKSPSWKYPLYLLIDIFGQQSSINFIASISYTISRSRDRIAHTFAAQQISSMKYISATIIQLTLNYIPEAEMPLRNDDATTTTFLILTSNSSLSSTTSQISATNWRWTDSIERFRSTIEMFSRLSAGLKIIIA